MKQIIAVIFGLGLGCNALLFVPQVLAVWRKKTDEGISLITFGGFSVLQAIGIVHGVYQGDLSLILGMAASLLTCGHRANLDGAAVPRYGECMDLTVQIPDDLARSLNAAGGDLSRRVLEALALDEYKSGRLTKPELRQALGFATGYELDGFLKTHQVWIEYDEQDLARERASLDRLSL